MKSLIAVYTNQVKRYCDQQFFRALGKATIGRDCFISVVDNTNDDGQYCCRLNDNVREWLGHYNVSVEHLPIDQTPKNTLFLRSVVESVNVLRGYFLEEPYYEKFIIFESDVIIPPNTLELFEKVQHKADIIGGIYYAGFHSPILFNPCVDQLIPSQHVLSGCTMYDREVIESFAFRGEGDTPGEQEFPDSCSSVDALKAGFTLMNYAAIKCPHLEKPDGSGRGMNDL